MLHRRERAESFIQRELTSLLRERVRDPRVSDLTLTGVELTQDRRHARVHVACYEGEERLQEGLEGLASAQGLLRRELAQRLHWRFTPQLEFLPDRTWQHAERMEQLFDQIAEERDAEEDVETDESE
jgi:ribosome-binding factor A